MYLKKVDGPRAVKMPNGRIYTQADLPPADTTRWVAGRKAAVITGLECGLISRDEAMKRWMLSDEEITEWQEAISQHGVGALKVTRLQSYRQP